MGHSRQVFAVGGADRVKFLQSLVTNDVEKTKDGLVYTALLTPQGKYLFDFFMVAQGDRILIDCDGEQAAALSGRLMMYKLRADVTIEPLDLHVHRGDDLLPVDGYADPRHAALGWRAYREQPAQETPDWTALNIANLVPETGAELVSGEGYILEMNFEALNGIDFRKGCYVGQEIMARMKHKTELRKGLARVTVDGETSFGDEITSGGKVIGKLLTRAGDQALAYLRFDRVKADIQTTGATLSLTKE